MTTDDKPELRRFHKNTRTQVLKHEGLVRIEVITEEGETVVQLDHIPADAIVIGEWLIALGRDQGRAMPRIGHLRLVSTKDGQ